MLEKKETLFMKKVSEEVERARGFIRNKNRKGAIQCFKRKKLYEQKIEQLGNYQLPIHDQMIMLEAAKATTETVDALRTGAAAMQAMQKEININDVDKVMDDVTQQTEYMKQVQGKLSSPVGPLADIDDEELLRDLESLAEGDLEEELLKPVTTAPAAPVQVPAVTQRARPIPQKLANAAHALAAIGSEMAL